MINSVTQLRKPPFSRTTLALFGVLAVSFSAAVKAEEATYQVVETESGASVTQGGLPVTNYLKESVSRPTVWPLYGPHQIEMTRAYPLREGDPEEKTDHIHHRSLWVGHEINGVDFWGETSEKSGKVKHVAFEKLESGARGVIETRCDWIAPDGSKVLEDHRRYTFSGPPQQRQLDFDVTLIASEKDLHFEDTKEGTVALRVAEWMKVDAKKGGELINEHGKTNVEAWGKAANWVDYTGKSPSGEVVGIAFFNHPQSFGNPTRWHVRTYGLFAANPFGVYHFEGGKEPTAGVQLAKGKTIALHHRIIFHEGRTDATRVNEWYKNYADQAVIAP